eukprot:gene6027-6728_t
MAENGFIKAITFGYKCALIFGVGLLLLAYTDVSLREQRLASEISDFKVKLKAEQQNNRRQRRDASMFGFDMIFRRMQSRLDNLERRYNQTNAFVQLAKSPFAALLPFLRGPPGLPGKTGEKGEDGKRGPRGHAGKRGPKGDKGEHYDHERDSTGSITYVRWGKKSCPKTPKTELIYAGRAAGQHNTHSGGMSNTVCLHMEPTFGKYSTAADTLQWIYGVEYEVANGFTPLSKNLHNKDAPCAVCHVETRGSKLMIPGRNICPSGWVTEYKGYLMSEHYGHKGRTTAVCVDADAEGAHGSMDSKDGNLWYPIQAACGSLPCGPYVQGRELTCVVCTK